MLSAAELLPVARAAVRDRLGRKGAAHCERTATTARELAVIHGVDPDTAELAGLLHDWSREESDGALLRSAEESGIDVGDAERAHPYLLHAPVGALRIREAFPDLGEDVVRAVATHTVGAVPMSDLQRVVYIADTIEPKRTFPGVEALRDDAYSRSLSIAFRTAYARAVRYVHEKGAPLHPSSAEVARMIEEETGSALLDTTDARVDR